MTPLIRMSSAQPFIKTLSKSIIGRSQLGLGGGRVGYPYKIETPKCLLKGGQINPMQQQQQLLLYHLPFIDPSFHDG